MVTKNINKLQRYIQIYDVIQRKMIAQNYMLIEKYNSQMLLKKENDEKMYFFDELAYRHDPTAFTTPYDNIESLYLNIVEKYLGVMSIFGTQK